MKIEKSSADLESEVIFRGLCAHCGSCGAFCPHIQYIEEGNDAGLPKILDSCIETVGVCYNSCPRSEFNIADLEQKRYGKVHQDEVLGIYNEKIVVKAAKGTILNALIETAFKMKLINAMIVPKKTSTKPVNSKGDVISDPKKLPELTSKTPDYLGPLLPGINIAVNQGLTSIGVIGNPCHHQGIAKMLYSDFEMRIKNVKLQISLMCSAGGGKGCIYCVDYAGEFADISYGETGQEAGNAVLLIRSETGKSLVEEAIKDKSLVKVSDSPNLDKIIDMASKKKRRNIKTILKKNSANIGYLNVTEDQLKFYFSGSE